MLGVTGTPAWTSASAGVRALPGRGGIRESAFFLSQCRLGSGPQQRLDTPRCAVMGSLHGTSGGAVSHALQALARRNSITPLKRKTRAPN